jgi:hypothetical protein
MMIARIIANMLGVGRSRLPLASLAGSPHPSA